MTRPTAFPPLVTLLILGCGATDPGANSQPSAHDESPPGIQSISAGMATAFGPMSIPAGGGSITYQISDQTQTLTSDHFDVAVLLGSYVQSWTGPGTAPAFAEKQEAVNASATTPLLQAGDYYAVVRCTNIVDNCILSIALTATY